MEMVEVTWKRALKVWWSFAWRGIVLSFAVLVPFQIALFAFVFSNLPTPGTQAPKPEQLGHMFTAMAIIWPLMMAGMIVAQTLAMRWMLRSTRWSDFRVVLTSPE